MGILNRSLVYYDHKSGEFVKIPPIEDMLSSLEDRLNKGLTAKEYYMDQMKNLKEGDLNNV